MSSTQNNRLWGYITDHSYQFDKQERGINVLNEMISKDDLEKYQKGKDELKQTFMDIFFNNPKILTVEIMSQNKYDNFTNEFEENRHLGGVDRVIMQETEINGQSYPETLKWRNEQMQYPDQYKCRWGGSI